MRILITAIVTFVVTSALFLLTARYKPDWLVKLQFDVNGFPLIRSKGDKFTKDGITYMFNGDIWVQLDASGFPVNPQPVNGDVFINNNVSYTYLNGVWTTTVPVPTNDSTRIKITPSDLTLIPYQGRSRINTGGIVERWVCVTYSGGGTICGYTSK